MTDASQRERLNDVTRKLGKQELLPVSHPSFGDICGKADLILFGTILDNPHHVLHHILPPKRVTGHNLRLRPRNREIPATQKQKLSAPQDFHY